MTSPKFIFVRPVEIQRLTIPIFIAIISLVLTLNSHLVTCQITSFSFPDFDDINTNRFVMLGDASVGNSSMDLNSKFYANNSEYSCGRFFYRDGVRMLQGPKGSDRRVASFSTSFTFEVMLNRSVDDWGWYENSDGFAFLFATDTRLVSPSGGYIAAEILCVNKSIPTTRLFAVEVDTWLNKNNYDPSDSHIGVDINSVIHNPQASSYVYNLCQGLRNESFCGYFANHPGPFTVWVDYDGAVKSLDVRFAPGLSTKGKPVNASIHLTNLDLSADVMNEVMYVGFSGSFGLFGEAHRILSWNFTSGDGVGDDDARRSSRLRRLGLISGASGACAMVVVLVGVFVMCYVYGQGKGHQGSALPLHLIGPRIFTYKELSKATNAFSEKEILGSGGFGAVYRGTLPGDMVVAVKRCTRPGNAHAEEGFVAEASSISQIRHRNLVHLQGWCEEKGQLLLVYDYMPNGSLDEWLFNDAETLSWECRHSILAGVAAALAHLHEEWEQCVLHRDIKSSNVMLDSDFNAHLGDFGLARLIDHHKAEKTTMMAGTLGYMAPEMSYTGKAGKETDVYSFGVLILEVICGKCPLNMRLNPEVGVLVDNVWRAHERGELLTVVDSRLGSPDYIATLNARDVSYDAMEENLACWGIISSRPNSVEDVLRLGLLCCQLNPSKRQSMRLVNLMFQTGDGSALPPLPATKPPLPYPFFESDAYSSITSSSSSTNTPRKLYDRNPPRN